MSDLDKAALELANKDLPVPDELTTLKARADQVGLSYHPNIGVDTLRTKLAAHLSDATATDEGNGDVPSAAPEVVLNKPVQAHQQASLAPRVVPAVEYAPSQYRNPKAHADALPEDVEDETPLERLIRLKAHANALIRVNISVMNPVMKEWEGEIITGGNSLVGSIKKFVHFNTTDGYHIPRVIYNILRDRECQIFYTAKDDRGNKVRRAKSIKEFAIEVLEPLTQEELDDLAASQAARGSIG
jgi:hypothetical protein